MELLRRYCRQRMLAWSPRSDPPTWHTVEALTLLQQCVAIRGDMDALPIEENTGLSFASTNKGVMHACGHDGHTAIAMGAAALLHQHRDQLRLPVRVLFQPAEEISEGARAMVEAGAMDDVAMVFGGHLCRGYSTGQLVVDPGCVNASVDGFRVQVDGRGGHGARPHQCVDSIVAAAQLVVALQQIVSRELNPASAGVVTVGSIKGGTSGNVIAQTTVLEGTLRAITVNDRQLLKSSLHRICDSIALQHNCRVAVDWTATAPPVINDSSAYAVAKRAAADVVGEHNVVPLRHRNMGGEDFSYLSEAAPGCFVRYGTSAAGQPEVSAHRGDWDFDEATLAIAARWLATSALEATRVLTDE